MTGQLLQFGVSLLAIFALVWLVHRLRLGGDKRIRDEAHARELADEVSDDFEPAEIAVDSEGRAALLRDSGGQIMVLKMHGSKAAGRVLGAGIGSGIGSGVSARIREDSGKHLLEVQTGERWFGSVLLDIDDCSAWQQAIESISQSADA